MSFSSQELCNKLKICIPIIQGGMVWVSGYKLAYAVSEAGALGVIGSGSMSESLCSYHIERLKSATDKSFAVNIPQLYAHAPAIVELCVKHEVPIVITSAGSPRLFTTRLKDAGIFVFHVVSSKKLALKAQEAGVDGLIVEGHEAGGHNGKEELSTWIAVSEVLKNTKLPVVAAGGIASGHHMAAALALGCAGVQVGTRFAASSESSAHDRFKDALIHADPSDTSLILRKVVPVRLLRNAFAERVIKHEESGASQEELKAILGKGRSKLGIFSGDLEEGELEIGQSVGHVASIQSASQIIREFCEDYEKAIHRLPWPFPMSGHEVPDHEVSGHEVPDHEVRGHEVPDHEAYTETRHASEKKSPERRAPVSGLIRRRQVQHASEKLEAIQKELGIECVVDHWSEEECLRICKIFHESQISLWIKRWHFFKMEKLAGDVSTREFWRLQNRDGYSAILMHRQPWAKEDCDEIKVGTWLASKRIAASRTIAYDPSFGLLLQNDLGKMQADYYFRSQPHDLKAALRSAVYGLTEIHKLPYKNECKKVLDNSLFLREFELTSEHFFKIFLDDPLTANNLKKEESLELFKLFSSNINNHVICHRDFHTRNLMIGLNNHVSIIDYQDAACGAREYDVASLVFDSYFEFDNEHQEYILELYKHFSSIEINLDGHLFRAYASQRHFKVLGTFSRVYNETHNTYYLKYIPYVIKCLKKHQEIIKPYMKGFFRLIEWDGVLDKFMSRWGEVQKKYVNKSR